LKQFRTKYINIPPQKNTNIPSAFDALPSMLSYLVLNFSLLGHHSWLSLLMNYYY